MHKQLLAVWFKECKTQKEKDQLELSIRNLQNDSTMKRLAKILEEREKELNAAPRGDYDNPSWAYKQADTNGQLRMLAFIKSLLLVEGM